MEESIQSLTVEETTAFLLSSRGGDKEATGKLMALLYSELRKLAAWRLARERADHTLSPTALVHEVFLKLIDQTRVQFLDRNHFMAVAAEAMRRILVDHARRRRREKHGGRRERVALDPSLALQVAQDGAVDLIDLSEALDRLSSLDERKRRVVELRFFAGLTNDETADVLGVSRATVANDWTVARAWLLSEMNPMNPGPTTVLTVEEVPPPANST